jgi:hypothetical protein
VRHRLIALIIYFYSPGTSLNPKRLHRKARKEREVLAEGGAKNHEAIEEYGILKTEPQMKAPRVAPLEDASTSTVTPVDCVHTYASALAYVDGRPQGAQPLTYAPQGIRVVWESRTVRFRSGEPAGFRQ